jgi:hypothetical protein
MSLMSVRCAHDACEAELLPAKPDIAVSEDGAQLSPPPPSAFNRKDKKQCRPAQRSQLDEEMRRFHSSQRKFTGDEILESELCPYSHAESLIQRAEALLFLDVVLNH